MAQYTLLTTFPQNRSSANVGDQLIEVATKRLLDKEKGPVEFLTVFREESLDDRLDEINRSAAILLPGFAIRDLPLYPGCYRLSQNLDEIKIPLIPIGANWNVYPGDAESRRTVNFSSATRSFLHRVATGIPRFSCREYFVCEVLRKHGIENTTMTGDPAWYDPDFLGLPFHRPPSITKVVFSPPLSSFYGPQAETILDMLTGLFPRAQRYCAMHLADAISSPFADQRPTNDASMRLDVAQKNQRLRTYAKKLGYEVLELAGDVKKLDLYRQCDLHVGYECHAHISFLRYRRPSVLLAEDARGVGFNYTFGVGGFDGFKRQSHQHVMPAREGGTSGYCVVAEEFAIAPARDDLALAVRQFLAEELDSHFRRYAGLATFIDETYETAMAPFLRSLP